MIKVTDALGISTLYTYDKAGNKLSMTDGRGKTTSYGYGAFGMLKSMTDADNQTMHYAYNLSGNTACVTDRNGNMLIHTYNNNNLVTERISVNTGESIQYSYDALGNRTGMADESGSYEYNYDPLNRLIRINKNGVLQLAYTYDDIGNIESVTDSKGFKTSYGYDKASRLETVTFNGRTTEYKYDVCGNRESVTYEGGVKEEYSYDKNNRLLKLTNRKPDNSVVSQYSYTYDITGRETSKTDSYGTTNYTYDQAGRVLKVEAPGKTTVYAYDKAGNRISLREAYTSNQPTRFIDEATKNEVEYILKSSQYVYSDTNRLLKLVEEMYSADNTKVLTKTIQYLYDANGNEVANYASYTHPHGEGLKRILEASVHGENQPTGPSSLIERTMNTFDGFNRLKKVEDIGSGVRTLVEYTYNGDDLRVQKVVRKSDSSYVPETTTFLYDRQHVILETDETNAVRTRYVKGINYIAQYNNGNELSYFLFNGHGDVVQTITDDGEVQNQYDYDIFGNATLTIEISACSIRYAGEYLDKETGLYYLRARYYQPYTGRFISEDSYWGEDSNPLSLNLYTYAYNSPIRYTDPTGHSPEDERHAQKLAIARLDALKKLQLTFSQNEAPESFRESIDYSANYVREQLLKYEQNEELRGLIQGDTKGIVGSWQLYKYEKHVGDIARRSNAIYNEQINEARYLANRSRWDKFWNISNYKSQYDKLEKVTMDDINRKYKLEAAYYMALELGRDVFEEEIVLNEEVFKIKPQSGQIRKEELDIRQLELDTLNGVYYEKYKYGISDYFRAHTINDYGHQGLGATDIFGHGNYDDWDYYRYYKTDDPASWVDYLNSKGANAEIYAKTKTWGKVIGQAVNEVMTVANYAIMAYFGYQMVQQFGMAYNYYAYNFNSQGYQFTMPQFSTSLQGGAAALQQGITINLRAPLVGAVSTQAAANANIAFASFNNLFPAVTSGGMPSGSGSGGSSKDANKVEFKGKTVTQNNNLFDPNAVDDKGRTNVQRMEKGLAPIGHDGKSVNVHHIGQTNTGPLQEMSQTNHQQPGLHQNTGQSPSQIDRNAFNQWRTDYWKWRASDFK